ncbi:MAG: PHB depolymerase family esterase [Bacteroidota bacterium]
MKRTPLLCLLFLLNTVVGFSQSDTLYRSIVQDGLQREYLLYVPEAYDGTEEWPLVLSFHGYGTNAFSQMVFSDMNPVADTGRFLIAYPLGTLLTSTVPNTPEQGLGFNIVGATDTAFTSIFNRDDVAFTSQVIDDIAADFAVDLSRVYSTGWSNGGFLSTILANELSDRIAAIAPVGGTIPRSKFINSTTTIPTLFDPARPVPALYVYGTEDGVAPYKGSDFMLSADEILAVWAASNGCDALPTVTRLPDLSEADSTTTDLIAWENCAAPVQHLRVNGGGHQWFGGPNIFPFLGNMSDDIHASTEIWKFFREFSLPSAKEYELPTPKQRPVSKTVEVAGLERAYRLYVPSSYDDSKETPLVFVYHGGNTPVEAQIDISIMNPIADTAGFIIAYPVGLPVFDSVFNQVSPSWTYPGIVAEHDDVAFTRQMIDAISGEYNINADRIYATGWSAGSEFAFHLACELPNQIAAIAGVGGQMSNVSVAACVTSERSMPVLQMHGTADVILPFDGAGVYPAAISSAELWANRSGCDEMPTSENLPNTVEMDNSTVTLLEYDNCNNDSEVLFYQIDGGGHNWSGGPLPFSLPFLASVNQDINASVEIWNFFNRHTLTRTATSITETLTATDFRVFPNPFTESLTVELDLPQSQAVQLQLLNVLGQPVSEIVNQTLPAGQQHIQWNLPSANLPAGVYYLHLTMNQQSFVRSVVYKAN